MLLIFQSVSSSGQPVIDECSDAESAWIFCSGFEEGDLSVWDDYDGNPPETNQLIAHPGPQGLDGNHVMRFVVPPGSGNADLVKVLPSQHDKLHARWYMMWEGGYDFGVPNHGSGLHAGDRSILARSGYRPTGADRFMASVEHWPEEHRLQVYSYYRGMYQDCADPEGACWGDRFPCMQDEGEVYCTDPEHRESTAPPILETNRWYCIELMVDGGVATDDPDEATGQISLLIDGVEYGPWTDLWMRTTPDLKLTILWLNTYFHGDHADAGVLIDHVVVSTEAIGPLDSPTGVIDDMLPTWSSVKSRFE